MLWFHYRDDGSLEYDFGKWSKGRFTVVAIYDGTLYVILIEDGEPQNGLFVLPHAGQNKPNTAGHYITGKSTLDQYKELAASLRGCAISPKVAKAPPEDTGK